MAQDFAKRRSPGKKPAARNKTGRGSRAATRVNQQKTESSWSWFFTGLCTGLFLSFIAYLAFLRPAPETAGPALVVDAGAMASEEQGENGRGNFDFYSYLPNAEVQVDVVPVETPQQATETPQIAREEVQETTTTRYLLQAGSFQNKQDAEGRRASLILLNMEANVVPGVVAGKTWHRVQVGPFNGRQAAEQARDTLSSNNIDTIVLRVR